MDVERDFNLTVRVRKLEKLAALWRVRNTLQLQQRRNCRAAASGPAQILTESTLPACL